MFSLDQFLFSVIVITFNQESIIEETLGSIILQEYTPLEVIICDDASTDNTGSVCINWIEKYGKNFSRALYNRNEKNLGIMGNALKGIGISDGTFIKILAGDDLLAPGAIRNAAVFFRHNPNKCNVFGNVMGFRSYGTTMKVEFCEPGPTGKRFFVLTPEHQFGILASGNPVPAPGLFARRSFFDNASLDGLKIKQMDDWTMWIKATSSGIRLNYHDFEGVYYRLRPSGEIRPVISNALLEDSLEVMDKIIKPNMHRLSRVERMAAQTCRMKISMKLKQKDLLAGFFNTLLTLLRFFVRYRLYR